MNVRRGVTLVEALIAIFLTAIGLLAILVLFSLGAIKMAYAIQADRVVYTSEKAAALAEARDIRHDSAYYGAGYDYFIANPVTATTPGALNSQTPPLVSYDGGGYPIYVDPLGVSANMAGSIGGSTLIARTSVSFVGSNVTAALYWFSLLDDLTFKNDGPNAALTGSDLPGDDTVSVTRTNKYSYAYMLRRPRYWDATMVDLSVVVYEKRPIQAASGEYVYPPPAMAGGPGNTFNPGNPNEVIVTYSGERPPLRRGGWLLDATVIPADATISNQPNMQGYFYRVADVTDVSSNSIAVQLEQPVLGTSSVRTFVIMEGVVEVVEKGSGWKP